MSADLFSGTGRKRPAKRRPLAPPAGRAAAAPAIDRDCYVRAQEALKLAEPIRRLERLADDLAELRVRGAGRRLQRVARYLRDVAADLYGPES